MTSFYYYYQSASVFCFLEKITAIVVFNLAGIAKFQDERKNEVDSVISRNKIKPSCQLPVNSNDNENVRIRVFFFLISRRSLGVTT